MPVITMTMGDGQTSAKQKKELIESFTQSAANITGIPVESFTILIYDLAADNIGVAGQTLTEFKAAMTG